MEDDGTKWKPEHNDGLSVVATTRDNDYLVTGDTAGQLKLWDISEVDQVALVGWGGLRTKEIPFSN